MVVLHGTWIHGRLLLWGETAAKAASASAFKYDAGADALGIAVSIIAGSNRHTRARHARNIPASLPEFPSRSYLMPLPDGNSAVHAHLSAHIGVKAVNNTYRKTSVTALPLSYNEMKALLSACTTVAQPYAPIVPKLCAGTDLIVISRIWHFASQTVARQLIVPGIVNGQSRWMPVLDMPDTNRLKTIISSLPPSVSCLEGAASLCEFGISFFNDAVDRIVRETVSTHLTRAHANRGSFDDVHSAWLASLRSSNPQIRWHKQSEIDVFSDSLERWRHPIVHYQNAKYRLGFRVRDPSNPECDNPHWSLIPLIVGSGEVRILNQTSLAELDALSREHILLSLGQASLLCPLLIGGVTIDNAIILDAPEVHSFLKNDSMLLNAAGFNVYSPSWWTSQAHGSAAPSTRIKIVAKACDYERNTSFFKLDDIVTIKWELVLGDDTLTRSDIEKILSSGSPLVRINTKWVFADRNALGQAVAKLNELNNSTISARDIVKLSFGAAMLSDGFEIDMSSVMSDGNLGETLSKLNGAAHIEDIAVPAEFNGELRPYQRRGLSWMAFLEKCGFGACLADDMGLGKTIETISLLLHLRTCGNKRPVLIICPMSIMTKWAREISRFAPCFGVWVFHGAERPHGDDFIKEVRSHDITITNYQLVCIDIASFKAVDWGVVVADEAQNIKNPATMKSQLVRSLKASWRLALTGTPVENNVGDLWSIMEFLNHGLLLSRQKFNEIFMKPIQAGYDVSAQERLKRITSPFILRRMKTSPEILSDLPPRVEEKVYCKLTNEQAELYDAEIKDVFPKLEHVRSASRRGAVLALLTRLKQICNHPEHYFASVSQPDHKNTASGKLTRLDELLDDILAAGDCALIFTQYTVMGRILSEHLKNRLGYEVPFLHGGVSIGNRDEMVARFQRPDGPPVLILSLKAGGTGLDLTRANHVIHYDRWWNPAVENQATDRAHRIGQHKTVFAHTLICEGTLESRIDDLITSKSRLAAQLIDSGDSWLAGFTNEQIRDVVSLSQESRDE